MYWQNGKIAFAAILVVQLCVLQLAATNDIAICSLSAEYPFTASPISGILSENQFNCVENGGNA